MIRELISSLATELELCITNEIIQVDGLKVYPYRLPFKNSRQSKQMG